MKKFLFIVFMCIGFWSFSQGIDHYFKIAADQNPELLVAYKDFEIALTRIDQVNTLSDPVLSLGYFVLPVETRLGRQRIKFSLSQMFPWFGTLKARGDIAALNAEAEFQKYMDAKNKLYYRVSKSYYPIYELNKLIGIEEKNIELLETYKGIAISHFENNKGEMVDVLRVDIMKNNSEVNLKILKDKKRFLNTRFNKLLNRDSSSLIEITDSIEVKKRSFEKNPISESHPLLKALDLNLEAGKVQERLAIKEGMPSFKVGIDYSILEAYPRNATVPAKNGRDVFMPMLSISLPVFRSKYKAAKRGAHLSLQAYDLKKTGVKNNLVTRYEKVYFEIDRQKDFMMLYERQISESKQSLDLLFTAYSNSGNDFEEVLRMEQQLLNYQKLKVKAVSNYMIAMAEMNYVTAKFTK